jgi:hypothetical protein
MGSLGLNGLNNVHAFQNLAEDDMLTVQPGALNGSDEELRTVGVSASIGHGKQTRNAVLQIEVLVGELLSIDGLTAHSVSHGDISSLEHKFRDDTVERRAFVVQRFSSLANALLTSAKRSEVLSSLGSLIGKELKGDATGVLSANSEVKEDLRVGTRGIASGGLL